MREQPYARPICRGSWVLGTACGKCEHCLETKPPMPNEQPTTSEALRDLGAILRAAFPPGKAHMIWEADVIAAEAALEAVLARHRQQSRPVSEVDQVEAVARAIWFAQADRLGVVKWDPPLDEQWANLEPSYRDMAYDLARAALAAQTTAPKPSGEKWRCTKCGAQADERWDCCEVFKPTPDPASGLSVGEELNLAYGLLNVASCSNMESVAWNRDADAWLRRHRERQSAALPAPAETPAASGEVDLFEVLRDQSWDLRCFDIPTGGGDADIGWRVVGHWMAEPRERTIAEVYTDNPRAAVKAALAQEAGRG